MSSAAIDTLLAVTKFVSISLTGLFGILSLAKKYRDDAGTLTRWGRIAVRGTIASFLVAAIAQSLELEKSRHQALASSAKTQEDVRRFTLLLQEIDRTAHPITDVRAGFSLTLPRTPPRLVAYVSSLDAAAAEIAQDFEGHGSKTQLQTQRKVVVFDRYGTSSAPVIAIEGTSPLLPLRGTEADAIVNNRTLLFMLYKRSLADNVVGLAQTQPDLSFMASADMYEYGGHLGVHYYTADHRIEQEGVDIKAQFLKQNGVLTSVLDIPGATLVVEPVNYRDAVEHDLMLDSVFLRLSQGYEFAVPTGAFRRLYVGNMPLFVYHFPKGS